ncbi:hypothetical protein EBB56_09375 [Halomonas sp. YLB-10]|uniref:hypothetical protein n=1 Tax=Halomonas sp. YLB-10 TaxID=2483111 RepID=UPI000F60387F|nr:hypothetical protein [Halomonas sp. YLB-10]RQW71361.1 hypothetical protein EBB56_09375 [Halomonas sp. YLB-10]
MARQAAMLCQDSAFRLYLDRRRRHKFGMTEGTLPDGTHNEQDARDWLCAACGIQSRAELDHSPEAERTFHQIRTRFNHWRTRNRVTNQRTGNEGP